MFERQNPPEVFPSPLNKETESYPNNFEILTPKGFYDEFCEISVLAQERVWAQTMYVEAGEVFGKVIDSLTTAKANGADSRLNTDYYSLMVDGQNINWIPSVASSQRRARRISRSNKLHELGRLERQEIPIEFTNPPSRVGKLVPFMGRNHIKLSVIDNIAYVGGASFRDEDVHKEDFMMRFTDPAIVEAIAEQFHRTNHSRAEANLIVPCTSQTSLLVDRGDKRSSIIYEAALQAVSDASFVRLITQLTPSGSMAVALSEAQRRGGDVMAVVSSRNTVKEWFSRLLDASNEAVLSVRRKNVPQIKFPTRVHAKALLTENVGIIGSHNLIGTGVFLGTDELSVVSSDPEFLQSLKSYFTRLEEQVS